MHKSLYIINDLKMCHLCSCEGHQQLHRFGLVEDSHKLCCLILKPIKPDLTENVKSKITDRKYRIFISSPFHIDLSTWYKFQWLACTHPSSFSGKSLLLCENFLLSLTHLYKHCIQLHLDYLFSCG